MWTPIDRMSGMKDHVHLHASCVCCYCQSAPLLSSCLCLCVVVRVSAPPPFPVGSHSSQQVGFYLSPVSNSAQVSPSTHTLCKFVTVFLYVSSCCVPVFPCFDSWVGQVGNLLDMVWLFQTLVFRSWRKGLVLCALCESFLDVCNNIHTRPFAESSIAYL